MKLVNFTSKSCSDGKGITKKSAMHVQSCCLANLTFCSFDVLVAVAVGTSKNQFLLYL